MQANATLIAGGLTYSYVIVDVEANPSDAASTTLTKLKVGNTVYSVPQGGGGGGTGDYTDLTNKPQINSVTLSGNVSLATLGIQPTIDSNNKLSYSLLSGTPTLATVATSGSYSDLSGKPTIPDTSKCVEKVFEGAATSGSTSITSLSTLMAKYSKIICYGHQQYAGDYWTTVVVDLETVNNGGTVNGMIAAYGWNRAVPSYFFRSGDAGSYYVNWNGGEDNGSPQTFTVYLILGVPKDAE